MTCFGALLDAADLFIRIVVSFSTSRCPHFCSWRPRTPHPQAPVAAGHGVLAGDEEQRQTIIRTHLHRRISNQRSRLRTPSLLSGRSTADRRPGLPRQVSASTARVAHRANSVLPRGCSVSRAVSQQSSHARFAERPPDFQVTNPRSDLVQNDFF